MIIRLEQRTDYKEVEFLIREAFWNVYRPGCYEHFIVHNLRHDVSFINQLDYVIEENGKIIAHIAYSTNKVVTDNGELDVVTLGPVSVHPDFQKQGYGTKIIEYTLDLAQKIEIPYVFVVGDENYYEKFAFENASKYGVMFNNITEETPFFMVKVFDNEKIKDIRGRYVDNECFKVDPEELEEFDKRFPPKEKVKKEGQLDF